MINDHTWDDISEPDGGHGNEAEVEGLEKGPLFPDCEYHGSYAKKDCQKAQGHEGRQEVALEPHAPAGFLISFLLPLHKSLGLKHQSNLIGGEQV